MYNINFDINKIKVNNIVEDHHQYNQTIIDNFNTLINYIKKINKIELDPEIKKRNTFRLKHLIHSTSVISSLPYQLTLENIKNFNAPGIGKGTIDRITEILKTKHLKELKELEKISNNKNIKIIDELNDIINIGDKRAIELIKKFKIKSIKDLQNKVNKGIIDVNDKIRMGLKYYGKYKTNIPRQEINQIYEFLNETITKYNPDYLFYICGSYRRGNPTSNDIDILLLHPDVLFQKEVSNSNHLFDIVTLLKKKKFIIDDLTEAEGTKYMGFCQLPNHDIRRIDIRMIAIESFVPAIVYFTGSYELNRQMRKLAKENGLKLNEYGLYDEKNNKPIILYTEEQLFEELGMDYLDPKDRNIY